MTNLAELERYLGRVHRMLGHLHSRADFDEYSGSLALAIKRGRIGRFKAESASR